MKKLFFFLTVAMMAFVSCEKDRSPADNLAVNFNINTEAFPTASEVLVYLVPSEHAGNAIWLDAKIGSNAIELSSDEQKSLEVDAYFSVILFDQNGKYLTQNFFPANSKVLKLKSE